MIKLVEVSTVIGAYRLEGWRLWILKRIAKRIVTQSQFHRNNIVDYLKIILEAAGDEFTEDNRPTRIGFIDDCYDDAKQLTKGYHDD